jgi:hypothetical protein
MNRLHEDFYLLMLNETSGSLSPKNRKVFPYGLAGALLAELVQDGHIEIKSISQIQVLNSSGSTGNRTLDSALKIIQEVPVGSILPQIVEALVAQSAVLERSIIETLLYRCVLQEQPSTFMGISTGKRITLSDHFDRVWVVMRLRNYVLAATPPEPRTCVLLDLLDALNRLPLLFDNYEMRYARTWVKPLTSSSPITQAVRLAYAHRQTISLLPV